MGAHKPWFRFYVATLEDPKVQRLPSELFRAWVNLLCIAGKNDGKIPSLADAAYGLRLKQHRAAALIAKLAVVGLLDRVDGGYFEPHNWKQWQYRGDHSTERVQLHRDRKKALMASGRPGPENVVAATKRHETVSCNGGKRFHETDQSTTEHNRSDDDVEDAVTHRSPPGTSWQAKELTKEIAALAGFDPARLPAGWGDAHQRVQKWIDKGWPQDSIRASVRLQCASPNRSTPIFVQYFEPGISDHIARQEAALPEATIPPARKGRPNHARYDSKDDPRSVVGALRRLRERPEMQAGGGNPPDGDPVRVLPSRPLSKS